MTDLIPQEQLLAKAQNDDLFKPTEALADLSDAHSGLGDLGSNFFADAGFTTIKSELAAGLSADEIAMVNDLGQQMQQSATSLNGMGDHIQKQVTALPQNLALLASQNVVTGADSIHSNLPSIPTAMIHADTPGGAGNPATPSCPPGALERLFGSLIGKAKDVMKAITNAYALVSEAIKDVVGTVQGIINFVKNTLLNVIDRVKSLVQAAIRRVQEFIQAEMAAVQAMIRNLFTRSLTGLLPSLFQDECVKQMVQKVGNAITA